MRTAILLLLVACSTSTNDNFVNPPPGPPATCTTIAALPGCDQGSLSFSCTADRPDDGDANLVCSNGTAGPAGTTQFCCAPFSQEFSDCVVDTRIAGCGGTSMGFACGATSPSDADPTIACGAGLPGNRYCCNTTAVPPTCAVDPTVAQCTGLAIGYSCVDGDAPDANDPELACAQEGPGSFCCIPFPQSAPRCVEDDLGPGCATGKYGFRCELFATPEDDDPALACVQAMATQGETGFCCDLK